MLRQATRRQHDRLDQLVRNFDISSPSGYATVLSMHGAVLPWLEHCLELSGVCDILPDWPGRRRCDVLRADLGDVSLLMPPLQKPAKKFNLPEMTGVLYVLEGSRLGNAFILNKIRQNPGRLKHLPLRFLKHGRERELWFGFLRWLDTLVFKPDENRQAIEAARSVFRSYERHVHRPTLPMTGSKHDNRESTDARL